MLILVDVIQFGSLNNLVPHEPWAFGEEVEEVSRIAINRRYILLPFFYTLFYQASKTG